MCDQMELAGPGKKLVRREVTRVITPGTATDAQLLEPGENNFLASVSYATQGAVGLAWVDISTGEFSATEFGGAQTPKANLEMRSSCCGRARCLARARWADSLLIQKPPDPALKIRFPHGDP